MRFEHPHILYFLFLLLIPVLVHLLRLQRFRKLDYPNVAYLRELERESRRSRRLRQWLLLASRILLLGFLVLAFARPYLPATDDDRVPKEAWFFVDNSPLSAYRSGKETFLDRLKYEALSLPTRPTHWHWLTPGGEILRVNRDEIPGLLAGIRTGCTEIRARRILRRIQTADTLPKKIYYFTASLQPDSALLAIRRPEDEWIFVFPPASPFVDSYIDTLFVARNSGNAYRLACVVGRKGPATDADISMMAGGQILSKQTLHLTGGGKDTVFLDWDKKLPAVTGEIRLSADGHFAPDDHLYFRLPQPVKPRVLLVTDSPKNYWKSLFKALDVQAEMVSPSHIPFERAGDFDAVVFYGWKNFLHPGQIAASFPDARLIFVPSGQASADRAFWGQGQSLQIDTVTYEINRIKWNHPLLKNILRKKASRFYAPRTSLTYVPEQMPAETVLSTENERPFLGKAGKWWVFYGSIDPPHGNFYLSPLMTSLFYRWFSGKTENIRLYRVCSDSLVIQVPGKPDPDIPVQMVSGGIRITPYQEFHGKKLQLFPRPQKLSPGIYALTGGTDTLGFAALNIPRNAVRRIAGRKWPAVRPGVRFTDNLAQERERESHSMDWRLIFLGLAMLFVFIEILIIRLWKAS